MSVEVPLVPNERTTPERRIVALYCDLDRAHARTTAAQVAEVARDAGFSVALEAVQDGVLGLASGNVPLHDADLLVTIGGDGTLLRGARLAAPLDIPLLGINTGRLGFLTEIEGQYALPEFAAMLREGYYLENRAALQTRADGGPTFFALNDIVVRKAGASRMVPFGLRLDGEMVAHLSADGIVIATPTGSTAYFLSAGGPIISPTVDAFGVVGLLPHTLFARPLIVPADSRIEITCDSEIVHAHLEADGERVSELTPESHVIVERYPRCVMFARKRPFSFFSRLESKLRWGVAIKNER